MRAHLAFRGPLSLEVAVCSERRKMPYSEENGSDKSRRTFLKEISAFQLMAATLGRNLANSSFATPAVSSLAQSADKTVTTSNKKKFVAIQIGARSFVDEGIDKCLDTLQERAAVNVLMPAVFTYGRALAGRQVPGQPLPDHGVQEYDEIHGGSYTRLHPEFYEKSVIKDFRAPELGDFDVLADVTAKARTRGMQVYCLFEEAYNPRLIPNFEKIAEVDVYGRIGGSTCHNNPEARLFLASMVKDWLTTNDLDGMMWESERQGPLNNTLEAHFGRIGKSR